MSEGWQPYAGGTTLGERGSEDGTILRDDEHVVGSRITLERTERFGPRIPVAYAITCGIYGWMLHTRFLGSESEAVDELEKMKVELAAIVTSIPLKDDPLGDAKLPEITDQIGRFAERFR